MKRQMVHATIMAKLQEIADIMDSAANDKVLEPLENLDLANKFAGFGNCVNDTLLPKS